MKNFYIFSQTKEDYIEEAIQVIEELVVERNIDDEKGYEQKKADIPKYMFIGILSLDGSNFYY